LDENVLFVKISHKF